MPILLPARRKMSSRKTANGEKTPCPGWKSSPPRWRGSAGLEAISASGRLDRVPIKWYHLIDKDAAQYQRVGACPDRKSRATFSGHALGLRRRRPRHIDILRPANPVIYAGPANAAGAGCRKHAQRMEAPPDGTQPPFDPPVICASGGGCLPPERDDDSAPAMVTDLAQNERYANQDDSSGTPLQGHAQRGDCGGDGEEGSQRRQ